jgi:peptidoglycan L-alanyl-D-glutamate endopeptidase CwlK
MPKFSVRSEIKLSGCHQDLVELFKEVVKNYDCTIIEGHRTLNRQRELYEEGKSKVLKGKHNSMPSLAVDVAPYVGGEISWDSSQCYHFAGYVQATADRMGIKIRWGGDWDGDRNVKDQTFLDLVHFELR